MTMFNNELVNMNLKEVKCPKREEREQLNSSNQENHEELQLELNKDSPKSKKTNWYPLIL